MLSCFHVNIGWIVLEIPPFLVDFPFFVPYSFTTVFTSISMEWTLLHATWENLRQPEKSHRFNPMATLQICWSGSSVCNLLLLSITGVDQGYNLFARDTFVMNTQSDNPRQSLLRIELQIANPVDAAISLTRVEQMYRASSPTHSISSWDGVTHCISVFLFDIVYTFLAVNFWCKFTQMQTHQSLLREKVWANRMKIASLW